MNGTTCRAAIIVCSLSALASTAYGLPGSGPTLSVERTGNAFALFLDGGSLNQGFETIFIHVVPGAGNVFLNLNPSGQSGGVPLPPGEQATFISRVIDNPFDPETAGMEFTSIGKIVAADTVEVATTILGGVIDTSVFPNGRLFLANLMPSYDFQASVTLLRAGTTVAQLSTTGAIPEPAAWGLTVVGTAALCIRAGIRRRTS